MLRRLAALLAVGLFAACATDSPSTPVTSTTAGSTTLVLDAVALQDGDSIVPVVHVSEAGTSRVAAAAEVHLVSSDTAVVAVAANGALIAVANGVAQVTATLLADPSVSTTQSINVTDPIFTSVSLIAPVSMIPGDTATFVVTGTVRGGRLIPSPVSVTVTSRNPAVIRASANQAIAIATGTSWIVARASNGVSDSSFVTVTLGAPAQIVLSPHTATLLPGQTMTTSVAVTDRRNNALTGFAPSYRSTSTTVASVAADGSVLARATGTTLIIATAATVADTLKLTVGTPVAVLTRLVVLPDSLTLNPGGASPISVQALDAQGNVMTLPTLTWQSLTAGITVSSTGLVQAASSITTTISNGVVQVSSGSVSATVRVAVVVPVVTPPPASDNGYVQIRWIGAAPSASVAAAFEAARARINSLFSSFAGVTQVTTNLAAGSCLAGTPALNESVKGIIIFAQVTAIDGVGSILGSAGPCIVRNGSLLPIVGTMKFDSADMDAMVANGTLNGVVLHEMMHTLGFGTIWGPTLQNEVASPSGTDPRYLGTNGQAAYAALGASDATTGVPVENTGGSGTKGSHWREATFRNELMTGWADGNMALSRVTIGALRDFGYDVNPAMADAYTLPASLNGAAALLVVSHPITEETVTPIGVLGGDGKVTPYTGH